ncbi:HEPN domain-containing protein [Candidatus Tokpelaia sp.]|uniref:HEPN domain-containing protein n=1 Tax=Candidatus Tokpelaia sp. TaxID=2233777 RepID=UPI00123C19B0|nr:HEPN domain-containing protein [Candidatus Tokpelaia sp.]KAA6406133.1 nucleotidyltransferase [Candidatus Tokpelaia sp.]
MMIDENALEERLRHLPPRRRRELAYVVKLLLENFQPAKLPQANQALRRGRILKIILFGSYARGKQVMDRKSGYNSDYDLLIIVNNKEAAAPENWYHVEGVLLREELVLKRINVPVEFIVHSYYDVNAQLKIGRPFFLDILRDGIELYAEPGYRLATPGNMTEKQQYEEAQKYFDQYYDLSLECLELAKFSFGRSKGKMNAAMRKAAFEAHQATESIYHCLLLTLTLYSPKLHNLRKLRSMTNALAPELASSWPQDKRAYKRCFELLRRAYVEARYSPHYKITALQLQWLFSRIENLQERVRRICEAPLRETGAEGGR